MSSEYKPPLNISPHPKCAYEWQNAYVFYSGFYGMFDISMGSKIHCNNTKNEIVMSVWLFKPTTNIELNTDVRNYCKS